MSNTAKMQLSIPATRSNLIAALVEKIIVMKPDLAGVVSVDAAKDVTLKSMALDSLDTLQLAMEIEETFDMEIDVVDFPPYLTIDGLASQLEALKRKQAQETN